MCGELTYFPFLTSLLWFNISIILILEQKLRVILVYRQKVQSILFLSLGDNTSTVQRLLTATPEQRPEPLIWPNNKVPANFALVLMVSLLPIVVTPVIRITASSPGPDKTSNAGTTASGRSAMCFSHLLIGDRRVDVN